MFKVVLRAKSAVSPGTLETNFPITCTQGSTSCHRSVATGLLLVAGSCRLLLRSDGGEVWCVHTPAEPQGCLQDMPLIIVCEHRRPLKVAGHFSHLQGVGDIVQDVLLCGYIVAPRR